MPKPPYVLLVEDDAALARSLTWAVLSDCAVTAVGTVREAREHLHGEWDVLLFDICLPDGCGLKLMRQARQLRPRAGALLVSGHDRPEDIEAAQAMGASFLAKPFGPLDILKFLDSCLPGRRGGGLSKTSPPPLADFSDPAEQEDESGLVPVSLPPEIASLVVKTIASVQHAATAESEHVYCLALLARAVGSGGLSVANFNACAEAIGVSRQTLQNFVTLTSRWDPWRIAHMLRMTDRSGREISKNTLLRVARGPYSLRREFDEQIARGDVDPATLDEEPDREGKSQ
ncbi:MAG: response regulator [Polyangiaceae bacterium]